MSTWILILTWREFVLFFFVLCLVVKFFYVPCVVYDLHNKINDQQVWSMLDAVGLQLHDTGTKLSTRGPERPQGQQGVGHSPHLSLYESAH